MPFLTQLALPLPLPHGSWAHSPHPSTAPHHRLLGSILPTRAAAPIRLAELLGLVRPALLLPRSRLLPDLD